MAFEHLKQWAEVPIDKDANYENTHWCNRDLVPIPPDRRTFGIWGYFGYWSVSGANLSAWTIGSTILAYGLSPQQSIACVVTGGILTGLLAVACGWMGEKHHIGFTVACRFSWGMRGSYFPVVVRIFVACIWFGIQSYWGGQATRVLIGAVIPGFAHMKNYFAPGSHLLTNDFIGMIIWYVGFILLALVPPERLKTPFAVSFIFFTGSCFGLLIWAVHSDHGPGAMFHQSATTLTPVWGVMYGITAILGAWGSGTLGQSDWTRYTDRRYAPTLSQLLAAPLTITVTALMGIIVTSAAKDILGTIIWNPIYLLAAIQEKHHSDSRVRASVFFASLGIVSSQLAISVVLNSVSAGMDMAGLCPKYINIRRGSYIMAIIGIASQPWQIISTATTFLQVLSGFGVFLAPMTGIMLADFFVIRRQKLRICDLYTGDRLGIYWYSFGFNWRAPVAFVFGVWPLMPGFITAVNGDMSPNLVGWQRLFNITFIIGIIISFTVMCVVGLTFPPPGLGLEAPFLIMSSEDSSISETEAKEDSGGAQSPV